MKLFVTSVFALLLTISGSAQSKKKEVVEITTGYGTIYVWLYDQTPKHKENFLKLVKEGFYENLAFHRVINEFMIQGGDPNTKDSTNYSQWGQGGPGYTTPSEFDSALVHKKGAFAAARMPDNVNPNRESSGSQFYIVQGKVFDDAMLDQIETYIRTNTKNKHFTYTPEQRATYKTLGGTPHLDLQYTVYGEVIKGLDVVDSIAAVQTTPPDRPVNSVRMKIKLVKFSEKELLKKFNFSIP